jgi:neutral ceramidase
VGQLLVGLGRSTITPPPGMFLMGYFGREHAAHSVHDDLVATALVFADGSSRAVIVTCDLLMLHASTVAAIRARIAARTGIPSSHAMICCSHTHSGPVTYVVDGAVWPERRDYLDSLVDRIVAAVEQADRSLQRAVWGVGRSEVEIGANRRQRLADGRTVIGENRAGPVDRDLLVLRVDAIDTPSGGTRPLALLVNHACHAVCLSGQSYVVSADWPGVMRRTVEDALDVRVGFLQGACADINPLGGPQDNFDRAQVLGARVARQVLDLYDDVVLQPKVSLGAACRDIDLPLLGPVDGSGRRVPPFAERAAELLGCPPDEALALLDRRFPWEAAFEERGGVWHTTVELQALSLDGVALVGVASEPFVEIGLQVKARSSAAMTLFAGYANGSVGYVPMPLAYDQGGYEVDASYVYYRLPAPLAPACAGLLIDGALAMIDALR